MGSRTLATGVYLIEPSETERRHSSGPFVQVDRWRRQGRPRLTFPATPEGIRRALDYAESGSAPQSRFERYTRTLRDDSNDPGAPGHERKASTTAGRHRATRPNLPFRFEWKPEYHPRDVHEHVGRMRARIDQGDAPWPLVTPNPEREAVAWAAKYLVVVIPLEDVPTEMYRGAA